MRTNNDTLELLAPLADAEREKRAKDVEVKRKLAAKALVKIENEAGQTIRQLNREIEAQKARIQDIENESKKARAELDRLSWKRYGESQKFDREKDKQKRYLLDSFDPELNRAQEHFQVLHDKLMTANVDESTRMGKTDLRTMTQKQHVLSNYESIRDAMKYCQDAIKTLEKWKLEPDCSYDAIEALKKDMPDPSIMNEYTGEKPMKSAQEIRYHNSGPGLLDARIERSLGYT